MVYKFIDKEHIELLDLIPFQIFWKDKKSTYQGCNKAFSDFIGLKINEIIGLNDYDLNWKEPGNNADYFIEMDRFVLSGHNKEKNAIQHDT